MERMGDQGYRYTLQPYTGPGSKHTCPSCAKHRVFKRYIDMCTGEQLAEHVGRCDREDKCGYHFKPREYFASGGERPSGDWTPPPPTPELPGYRMSRHDVHRTMGQPCHLLRYLTGALGQEPELVTATAREYCVGGWPEMGSLHGATVFWQVDRSGEVRAAKVIQYDAETGRRVKDTNTTWVHALNGGIPQGYKLEQCLFGEHLLDKYPAARVAIVEAEKTALVARMLIPDVLWLAVGALGELKLAKLMALAGRDVYLWPDLGKGFEEWSAKVPDLEPLFCSLTVMDVLERMATDAERANGLDLADYLLSRNAPAPRPKPKLNVPPAPLAAGPIPPPLTPAREAFARMAEVNPALDLLAEVLDLDLDAARLVPVTPAPVKHGRRVVVALKGKGRYASAKVAGADGTIRLAFEATSSGQALVMGEMEALKLLDAWRSMDLRGPEDCIIYPVQ